MTHITGASPCKGVLSAVANELALLPVRSEGKTPMTKTSKLILIRPVAAGIASTVVAQSRDSGEDDFGMVPSKAMFADFVLTGWAALATTPRFFGAANKSAWLEARPFNADPEVPGEVLVSSYF